MFSDIYQVTIQMNFQKKEHKLINKEGKMMMNHLYLINIDIECKFKMIG